MNLKFALPAGVRSSVWPKVLGAILILGLLMTFHQVVSGAVQQGELLRKSSALKAEATWRCSTVRSRDSCMQSFNAAPHEATRYVQAIASNESLE